MNIQSLSAAVDKVLAPMVQHAFDIAMTGYVPRDTTQAEWKARDRLRRQVRRYIRQQAAIDEEMVKLAISDATLHGVGIVRFK